MDADFDFLSYLDFGGSASTSGLPGFQHQHLHQQQQHQHLLLAQDDSSFSSISSDHSSFPSPQDRVFSDFGGNESVHSSTSPPAAGHHHGYPQNGYSPVFGSGGNPAIQINDAFALSNNNAAGWTGNAANSSHMNNGNSPPFDTSIYNHSPASNANGVSPPSAKSFDFSTFGNINLQDFRHAGPNQYSHMGNFDAGSWQASLFQQQHNVQSHPQQHSSYANTYSVPASLNGTASSPGTNSIGNPASPNTSEFSGEKRMSIAGISTAPTPVMTQDSFSPFQTFLASYQDQPAAPLAMQQQHPLPNASKTGGRQLASLPKAAHPAQKTQAQVQPPQQHQQQPHLSLVPSGTTQPLAPVTKKATLKRTYQQVKQEDPDAPALLGGNGAASSGMQASTSQSSGDDASGEAKAGGGSNGKGGHNAVEQKYRRGINDSLIMLREIVPALGHLRAAPGTAPTKRKISQFSLAAAATPAAPSDLVDGVMPPKKLSKQLILVTATDYIRYLVSRRDELEGELDMLRQSLVDCLEDANVVTDLAEQRWAPERSKILKDREQIYEDRRTSKDKIKKRKLDGDEAGSGKKGGKKAGDSDDESDDSDDDEEMLDSTDMPPSATSSALQAKSQAKPRGRPKKAAAAKTASSDSVARTGHQQKPAGPPKALLSIFGGVSFVGGAGYDMLYGASNQANAPAHSQAETVNPARVWSHGLVRRASFSPASPIPSQHFSPVQTFFIERPALLSGLVTLSVGLAAAYVLFYVIPSAYRRLTSNNRQARKEYARAVLIDAAKNPAQSSRAVERRQLALLAGDTETKLGQILSLPSLVMKAGTSWMLGPQIAAAGSNAGAVEKAASSLKVMELDLASGTDRLSLFCSFLHLYALTRSSRWPSAAATHPLTARAEATLALATISLFGTSDHTAADRLWSSAQARLKKDDVKNDTKPWLRLALSHTLPEAIKSGSASLVELAEARAENALLQTWRRVFSSVISITTALKDGEAVLTPTPGKVPLEDLAAACEGADEVLSAMPASSRLHALALLCKGVQAIGQNEKTLAWKVAVSLSPFVNDLASVKAWTALVSGTPLKEDISAECKDDLDCLAYATISWLAVRQAATSLPSSSDAQSGAVDDAMQVSTVQLRRLLTADCFTSGDMDTEFVDAQERCIDSLIGIGRKAAGLESLSDSGCEL